MPQYDANHVKLCGGRIVWDGVTAPETVQQGQQAGKLKYTLKAVYPPGHPDVALFNQLANQALAQSKWRGQLPPGGRMPVGTVQPGEFNDVFPGWSVISFKTTLRAPDVYDEHGAQLDPMTYGPQIFGNQVVDILGHCYEYDAAGNRGVSAGLDAFAIIASANAERMQFGGGGIATAGAFGGGGGPAPGAQTATPGYTHPAANAPGQPAPGAQGATPGQQPAQAHNFLPGGAPGAPGAPAAPAAEPKYQATDGQWTFAQLTAAGWPPEAITALPLV